MDVYVVLGKINVVVSRCSFSLFLPLKKEIAMEACPLRILNKHTPVWVTVGMLSISILLALLDIITLQQVW